MYPHYGNYSKKTVCKEEYIPFPPQHQDRQPGLEYVMIPRPIFDNPAYLACGKLMDKVAIITGGDSGIGRAVSIAYAKEGADVVIVYYDEHRDAEETKALIEQLGRRCLLLPGDLRHAPFSAFVVQETLQCFGKIDILVNNCGVAFYQQSILDITDEQLHDVFMTNIYSFFYMSKACIPHLKSGSAIVNTASSAAYLGFEKLIDYSASKGAVVSFTRSLSLDLVKHGIRVNAVAPGPVWTPLIPAAFPADLVSQFGAGFVPAPMGRASQPFELAPTYVYLASEDSNYVSGQVLHVNGGSITGT